MNKQIEIITICGSMRFSKEIMKVSAELETEKGLCVLQPVYNISDRIYSESEIENLRIAHFKKIDISDAIYVVNVDGYVGESVAREIEYAKKHNKIVLYMVKQK